MHNNTCSSSTTIKHHSLLGFLLLVMATLASATTDNISVDDELLSVVVIYRHGDRTPVQPYPNDPYRNASYWPVGFGELTNLGKQQQYALGKWLRTRYNTLLPSAYAKSDIYVRATDVDRVLMSAEANLAGLYPPHTKQIWDAVIPWQPIPVHTAPEQDDAVWAMKQNCPKYNALLQDLFKSQYFIDVAHKNHDLYAYLTRYSGVTISTLDNLEYLYNTLFIETQYNLTLPQWAQKIYPDKLYPWAAMSFATPCYTRDLARLKTGPFFNLIVDYFRNVTLTGTGNNYKMLMFSGHDTTIANILNSLGAFEYHCPPYASTILFELRRRNNSNHYINVFYKNSTTDNEQLATMITNITIKGCQQFDCDFDDFVRILKPITITLSDWMRECRSVLVDEWITWNNAMFIVTFGLIVASIIVIIFLVATIRLARNKKDGVTYYTQLPVEDVA